MHRISVVSVGGFDFQMGEVIVDIGLRRRQAHSNRKEEWQPENPG